MWWGRIYEEIHSSSLSDYSLHMIRTFQDYRASEYMYSANLSSMMIDFFAAMGWVWDRKRMSKEVRTITTIGQIKTIITTTITITCVLARLTLAGMVFDLYGLIRNHCRRSSVRRRWRVITRDRWRPRPTSCMINDNCSSLSWFFIPCAIVFFVRWTSKYCKQSSISRSSFIVGTMNA